MRLILMKNYIPKKDRPTYEKNRTHSLMIFCYVGKTVLHSHRYYAHFDNFHELYFDLIRDIAAQVEMYRFKKIGEVDERRSRNDR